MCLWDVYFRLWYREVWECLGEVVSRIYGSRCLFFFYCVGLIFFIVERVLGV